MNGFLFDENLPLIPSLKVSLPIVHARDVGSRPTDSELWNYARRHNLAIVSKDSDFSQRMILSEPPPRVIHLRVGNMRYRDFVLWLERVWPHIEAAVLNHKLIIAYLDRIEAID